MSDENQFDNGPAASDVTFCERAECAGARIHMVAASDVEIRAVRWLWEGRFPLGKLVVVDGLPGQGKSSMLLDVGARVTTGREMPDGSRGLEAPADILILS